MRYIDGDKLESKIQKTIYDAVKKQQGFEFISGLEEACKMVRMAHTLKDPNGKNCGINYAELKRDFNELKEYANKIESGEIKSEMDDLRRENSDLKDTNTLLREAYKELNTKYINATASATQELRANIEELNKELVVENGKLASKESELLILNNEYAKALSKISELKKKCKTYTKEISKQANDNVHLLRTIERLTLEVADKLQEEQDARN